MPYRLKLVSYKLCPYVQRAVITLLHKRVNFEVVYIDLANKPDWFVNLSPLGKVPVLQVNEDAVIFESAVINEFLSEIFPPALHPADPIRRAHNRAWIEYSSYLLNTGFRLHTAPNEAAFIEFRGKLRKQLKQLEKQLKYAPFFNGDRLCLIDAAYAPFFLRQNLVEQIYPTDVYTGLPRVHAWQENLLAQQEIRDSVVEDYPDLFYNFLRERSSFIAHLPV